LAAVSIGDAPSFQVLICIRNYGRAYWCVPFNTGPWLRVRDHFGDHFVRWTFVVAGVQWQAFQGEASWMAGEVCALIKRHIIDAESR